MAEALAGTGDEVHLVAPADPRSASRGFKSHPLSSLVRFRPRPSVSGLHLLERPLFDAILTFRLLGVVRRERLEVLHAHNHEGLAAALVARAIHGVPVVYHAHNVAEDELPLYAPRGLRSLVRHAARLMDRWLPRCADAVVALSEDVADHLVRAGASAGNVSVVPPGLDPVAFGRLERGLRGPRVVFTGNLDEYQNLDFLMTAWRQVEAHLPRAELRIVTHARGAALARGRARSRGTRVVFVEVDSFAEVLDELAHARVGVSPRASWSGFPIKTLNYMAAGLPTIAAAGSAKGVEDGETGWVVDDGDVDGFAAAMVEALKCPDEAARRGAQARVRLGREHSWPSLIARVRGAADRAMSSAGDLAGTGDAGQVAARASRAAS